MTVIESGRVGFDKVGEYISRVNTKVKQRIRIKKFKLEFRRVGVIK